MLTKTKSYEDLKEDQLKRVSTRKVTGIRIEMTDDAQARKRRSLFPIVIGCICVQDTPQSPCPCHDKPPIIVWLTEEKILKEYKSDKLNHDGQELTVFEMESDATIYVERMQPINLSRFSGNGHGHNIGPIGNNANLIWAIVAGFDIAAVAGMVYVVVEVGLGASDALAGVDNSPHWVP